MPFKAGAIYGEARLDTKKWTGGMKKITKSTKIAMAAITVVISAAMIKSIKAANEYQKALANVSTLIDTTAISVEGLSKQLLQLDPALGATTELTNGLYQAFSAGAKTAEEAMELTVQSAKFAKAGLTDTFTAVDVLSTAMNAYGKEVVNAEQASDIFFTTIKQGKVTGEELATSIGTSIPLFSAAKIPLEELSAGLAAMTKQGTSANKATTQLNAIVNSFLKPSEEMVIKLKEMGFASGSAFLEAKGLAGALSMLEEATEGDASEIAKLVPNIRGMRGVMALTGVGAAEFTSILEEMNGAAGATEEAFSKQEKTWDTLKNSMDRVSIVAGNIGKHFVDKIVVSLIQSSQATLDFIMSNQGMELVSQVIGKVAGAFELVKTGLFILKEDLLPPLISLWDTIKESVNKVTGETEAGAGATHLFAIALKGVSMAITIVIKVVEIAITAIADLVIAIKSSAEAVGSFFDMLKGDVKFKDVKESFKQAGEAFKDLGTGFAIGIGELVAETKDQFKNFGAEVEDATLTITTNVRNTSEAATAYMESNWDAMLAGVTNFMFKSNIIAGEISNNWKENNDDMTDYFQDTTNVWVDIWAGFGTVIEKETEETVWNMEATWQDYFNSVLSGLSSMFSQMSSISSQEFTNEQALLDLDNQEKLAALQEKFDNELLTEEEFDAAKEALAKENLIKQNELASKKFEADKKNKKTGVWLSAAQAVMGWWEAATVLGPIAGPIFASAMSLATVGLAKKQTGLIDKQQFVPAMAKGGTVRINEEGGEIVNLPDGSLVIPNDISRQIANNSGSQTIVNVNFAGAHINNDMDLNRITEQVSRKLGRQLRTA